MAKELRKGKGKAVRAPAAHRKVSQQKGKAVRATVARRSKVSQQKGGSDESDESHSDDRPRLS